VNCKAAIQKTIRLSSRNATRLTRAQQRPLWHAILIFECRRSPITLLQVQDTQGDSEKVIDSVALRCSSVLTSAPRDRLVFDAHHRIVGLPDFCPEKNRVSTNILADISSSDIKGTKTMKMLLLTRAAFALSALVPSSSKHGVCRDELFGWASPVFGGWKDGRFWYKNEQENGVAVDGQSYLPRLKVSPGDLRSHKK